MGKVKCYFTGARPLKDGSLTGMLVFNNISKADRHALLDMEGEVFLTNDPEPDDVEVKQALKLKEAFKRIADILSDINTNDNGGKE